MPTYRAPVDEVMFLLRDVFHVERYNNLPGFAEATPDIVEAVLAEAAKFCEDVLTPLNRVGDKEGCRRHADGSVTTPPGFKDAYEKLVAGGWVGASAPAEFGGQGLPTVLDPGHPRVPVLIEHGLCHVFEPGAGRGRGDLQPRFGRAEGALPAKADQRRMGRHHEPDRAAMRHRSRSVALPRRAAARRQLQNHRHQDFHFRRRARSDRQHHPSGAGAHRRRAPRHQGHFAVHRAEVLADRRRRARANATRCRAARSKRRWASTATPPAS